MLLGGSQFVIAIILAGSIRMLLIETIMPR
jgi:hypothetical protein